jgi:crotonobetainyl-CoA:carnitine CoA-transferase CaiB-like acyl-CoA transferase
MQQNRPLSLVSDLIREARALIEMLPEGKEVLKRLVAQANVLVENFRLGVMDRLALGYDTLSQVKPSLVYCAIPASARMVPSHSALPKTRSSRAPPAS